MGEPERRVAALLMRASTVQQAEYVLFADAAEFDPDELVRELRVRQRAFAADGQAKAAALVDFYVSLVRELRPALLAAVARRHEEPDDTWQATERQASELLKQGRLDAAHDLVRAALRSVRTGSYANGRFLGIQVLIAKAMHAAGRSRGALEILDSLELGPASGRGDVAVDAMLRARLHQLRGGMYQAEAQYERARSEYASALELLQQVGSVDEELTIRLELADAQLAAGRSRDAVREYRRVLTRAESKGVAGEPLARVLNRLGEAYRKAGDAAAARSCHRRALELTDDAEVDEPRTLRAAEAWVGLGDLAADAGNGSEAAEAYFQALTKSMTVNRDATAHGMHLVASRVGRLAVPDADLLFRTAQIFRDMFSDPERYWSHHLPFRLAEAAQQGAGGDIDGSIAALRTLRGECLRRPSELKIGMEIDDRLAQALLVRGSRADRQGAFDLAWQRRSELLRSIAHRAHRANGDVPSLVVQYRASYELLVRSLLDHGREIEIPAEDRPGTAAEQDEAVELAFNLHEEYKAWVDLTLNPAGTLSTPATLHGLRDCLAADPDAENCAYVSYFCGTNATTIFVLHADTGRVTFFRTELTEATVKRTAERLRRVFDGDAGAFPAAPAARAAALAPRTGLLRPTGAGPARLPARGGPTRAALHCRRADADGPSAVGTPASRSCRSRAGKRAGARTAARRRPGLQRHGPAPHRRSAVGPGQRRCVRRRSRGPGGCRCRPSRTRHRLHRAGPLRRRNERGERAGRDPGDRPGGVGRRARRAPDRTRLVRPH